MRCTNPIVSTSRKRFAPAIHADDVNGHRTYYSADGEIYGEHDVMRLPCRKCYYCLKARAREWTLRCALEAMYHDTGCVLTLTYADSPRTLVMEHVQLFIKRLRKHIDPLKIRYFYAGEYGAKTMPPHYHMIIYGWQPSDARHWDDAGDGTRYWVSDTLNAIWSHGWVTVDLGVTVESAAYCAGYSLSKLFAQYPQDLLPPYQRMSLKPGLGYQYYADHADDIYGDAIYVNGAKHRPPKYYDTKYKQVVDPAVWDTIIDDRVDKIVKTVLGDAADQRDNLHRVKNLLIKSIDDRSKV